MVPEAKRRWFFGASGYITVRRRSGGSAFNVSIQLNDFEDFVELIEPGSKKEREPKYNPKSRWNRELFK